MGSRCVCRADMSTPCSGCGGGPSSVSPRPSPPPRTPYPTPPPQVSPCPPGWPQSCAPCCIASHVIASNDQMSEGRAQAHTHARTHARAPTKQGAAGAALTARGPPGFCAGAAPAVHTTRRMPQPSRTFPPPPWACPGLRRDPTRSAAALLAPRASARPACAASRLRMPEAAPTGT